MTSSTKTKITCHTVPSGDNEEIQTIMLPRFSARRKCTNTGYLIAFVLCFGIMILFSIVLSWGGDLNKFLYGHDMYGNTCGIKNKPIRGINCSGQDMTYKPFALLRYFPTNKCFPLGEQTFLPYKCIEKCHPPFELIFHRCYPPGNINLNKESIYIKQLHEILQVLQQYSSTIIVMSITGFVLAFGIYFCIRYSVAATFWSLIVLQLIISILVASFFTHKYITNDDKSILFLFIATSAVVYFIFIIIFLYVLLGNLNSIFQLHQETVNAIFKMPVILIQPFLNVLILISATSLIVIFIILIMSKECFKQSSYDRLTNEQATNTLKLLYVCFLLFMMLWTSAFVRGWQSVVTSGAIVQYYLTRDKSSLQHPFRQSINILMRYHLGTIAYGSLIKTFFMLLGSVAEFFIRKAYTQTALHGCELLKSILRVIKLLGNNLTKTVLITAFNYFVTYGYTLLVVSLTVAVGTWMNLKNSRNVLLSIFLGAIAAAMMAHFVLQILHIANDAVFLYSCEKQTKDNKDNKNTYESTSIQDETMTKKF